MAASDPVVEAARAGEPDRYLSALYAPELPRGRLIALAAFQADLARIAATVREPMLAEIRLQWWRDALAMTIRGEPTGHPIADRLGPDLATGLLPAGLLLGMIDAAATRNPLRDGDPQALKAHLNKSEGAAFSLAARACGAGYSVGVDEAAQKAGFSYGLARLLAQHRHPPASPDLAHACSASLTDAASSIARLDTAVLPAFLPLTMTPAYLRLADGSSADRTLPLQRWWRIGRAGLSGRVV